MFDRSESHPNWEVTPATQRNLGVTVALIAAFVLLVTLIAGAGPGVWDQLQPSGVAHRIATIRSG